MCALAVLNQLKNLHTLSTLLIHIATTQPPLTAFTLSPNSPLTTTITTLIGASHALPSPITLTRTPAIVPLSGIDIPFHSSLLRPGVPAFRKFLSKQIRLEDVVPEQFLGKYVPNLTATTFEISKEYVEEVGELTRSETLRKILDEWSDTEGEDGSSEDEA